MKELRIIIAGSRDFNNYDLAFETMLEFWNHLDNYPFIRLFGDQVKIISGKARGADRIGEWLAEKFGLEVIGFPADWDGLGKRAGYVRNAEMAKYAIADGNCGVLIAFWDGKSKGTKHMIDLAEKNGLEVHVVRFS